MTTHDLHLSKMQFKQINSLLDLLIERYQINGLDALQSNKIRSQIEHLEALV